MSCQDRIILDPYPEVLGLGGLKIIVPEDFRGDATVIWGLSDKPWDANRQWITCNTTRLLQGVFHDVHGERPGNGFDARVVALVVHAFYRARIEAAVRLEAAYVWQPH